MLRVKIYVTHGRGWNRNAPVQMSGKIPELESEGQVGESHQKKMKEEYDGEVARIAYVNSERWGGADMGIQD